MTLKEQCETCLDHAACRQMYGRYFLDRAKGWRPDWKADGTPRPICGCRWRRPVPGAPKVVIAIEAEAEPMPIEPPPPQPAAEPVSFVPRRRALSAADLAARLARLAKQ